MSISACTFVTRAVREMFTTRTAKTDLRKQIKKVLNDLPLHEKKRQSETVIKKLFNLPLYKQSRRISVYLSTMNEIDTEPIVRNLLERDKFCFIPRYDGDGMEMVRLHSLEDWENLPLTKWKIKQPLVSEKRENALDTGGLDLIIVPGVGFTKDGARLGHGKGYYDNYQTQLFDVHCKRTPAVGLAFREQILQQIPVEEHDVKVDVILYPD